MNGSNLRKHEFGGTGPIREIATTQEGPFTRDVVMINIWIIVLWALILGPILEGVIIKC